MKLRAHHALAFLALAFVAGPSLATSTTVSIKGRAIPGKQVIVQATVTGSHIVWDGPGSVPAGAIKVYGGGSSLGQGISIIPNSTGVSCYLISDPSFNRICHGTSSTVSFPFTFPAGAKSTVGFYAHFDGDPDSGSSSSQTLTVTARRPAISPVIDLLFSD